MGRMSQIAIMTVVLVGLSGSTALAVKDRYRLDFDLHGFVPESASAGIVHEAGKGSNFKILSQSEDALIVTFTRVNPCTPAVDASKARTGTVYSIDRNHIKNYHYSHRYGFPHGPLVVPFKLRAKTKTLTGESTVGYYIGHRRSWFGLSATLLGTAGLAMIPINDINSGDTENRAGLSYAVGVVVETSSQFQLGLVLGWDQLGENGRDDWKFERDPWLSFSIGFQFMSSTD